MNDETNEALRDKLWEMMDGVFIYKEWWIGPWRIRRVNGKKWLVYHVLKADVMEFKTRRDARKYVYWH